MLPCSSSAPALLTLCSCPAHVHVPLLLLPFSLFAPALLLLCCCSYPAPDPAKHGPLFSSRSCPSPPVQRLPCLSSCPAPALLLPYSCPPTALLLLCSCLPAPTLLLPHSCSCPTPAPAMSFPAPAPADPSLAAFIIISTLRLFRHGESRLLWYYIGQYLRDNICTVGRC